MHRLRWRWFTMLMLTAAGTLLAGAASLAAAPRGENVLAFTTANLPEVSWHPIPRSATAAIVDGRRLTGLFLIRDGERWRALAGVTGSWFRQCTVRWKEFERRFEDPCDGNQFNLKGEVLRGRSPRGLYRFPVTVAETGHVLVDVGHPEPGPLASLNPKGLSTFYMDTDLYNAAHRYVRTRISVEVPDHNTLGLLLEERTGDGRAVIISYRTQKLRHIAVLLHLNRRGEMIGGGAVGTVVLLDDPDPMPVGWTWMGRPGESDYAFYGPVSIAGTAQVEVTEQDGSVHVIPVMNQMAWFISRPYGGEPGTGWEAQVPARIRAIGRDGRVLFERNYPAH